MLGDMWGQAKAGFTAANARKFGSTAMDYGAIYGEAAYRSRPVRAARRYGAKAWGRVPAGARPYARGAAALTAYGTAYNMAPGTMTMGTVAAGAGIGMYAARYKTGTMRTAAGRFGSYSRRTGQFVSRGGLGRVGTRRLGAGVIGAVGGMGVAMASRALFGPSSKSNTTLGSNR